MRLYSESSEETLRAHRLLKEWNDDGLLSKEQYERLEQETTSDLRTTNIFLRIVLFFFTIIVVAAAVALFFVVALTRPSESTGGVFFLIFAVLSYIAAEVAARQARLYRHGIEEALAVCSVALLCGGLAGVFFVGGVHSEQNMQCLVCAAGAEAALWIWHRFGLWYAFPAAMIFAIFLPAYATTSPSTQRVLLCVLYAAGLVCVAAIRSRHRFDYLEQGYSLAEAFLWLGIYVVLNLKLSAISEPSQLWTNARPTAEFAAPFYWTTWVLLWCLSAVILARGVRQKDRFVLAVGMLTTVLTFVTNKPYLGWQRHTWDPMLLGIALAAVAVFLGRWLAKGPGGVRHGFTTARLSAKDKHAMSIASSAFGLLSPQSITPAPQQKSPEFGSGFGGGSDGGGSSGDF
jgi:hypothetical protein